MGTLGVIHSDPRPSSQPFRHYRGTQPPSFAHPSEEHFARLLDDAEVPWLYEPHTFVLERDAAGRVRAAMTPDFYLPEADIYVECTTMKQRLVSRKNGKLRRLQALHDIVVVARYRRDLERLGWVGADAA